jgi:hypothetical protein
MRPNGRQNARNHLIHGIIGIWPHPICKVTLAIQINGHGIKGTKALFTEEDQQELNKIEEIADRADVMHTQAMEDLEIDPLEAAELAAELNEQTTLAENIRERLTQPIILLTTEEENNFQNELRDLEDKINK